VGRMASIVALRMIKSLVRLGVIAPDIRART
jgi:hypothetical protein